MLNMLQCTWLVCLLAGVRVAAKPVHGSDFDLRKTCPAAEYPKHHTICMDVQYCIKSGQTCLSCGWGPDQTNVAACCEQDQLPTPSKKGRYPCARQAVVGENGTYCKLMCCGTGSVVCGDGCCRTGDHGHPHKCGRTLKVPRQGKGGKACCIEEGASAAQQEKQGCCVRGQGLNCLQNETPCCLWAQGDEHHTADPDPHSPCQPRNCSLWRPCPHGPGYDCLFHGQKICCLRPGGNVSVSAADPCQRFEEDCQSRWQGQCRHGLGSDCSKDNKEACCLELPLSATHQCQMDCNQYRPPPKSNLVGWALAGGCAAMVLTSVLVLCIVRKKCRRSPAPHGSGRPPALVLYNSSYVGAFNPLPWARKDGEEMALMFDKLGYHAIDRHDITCAVAKEVTQRLLDDLEKCGIKNPVVPIFFAGHGVEVGNSQFLVPSDAHSQNDELISLDSIMCRAAKIHRRSRDPADAVQPTFLLILDTCRSTPSSHEVRNRLADVAAGQTRMVGRARQLSRPDFVIIHACECGGVAQQCPSVNMGYLTKAFTTYGCNDLSLEDLLKQVQREVEEDTRRMHEQNKACSVQKPEVKSTTSTLDSRYLPLGLCRV
ncbi:unnamed protein product [Symbiodinium sp. CCMP2592]|nr:unnamed protein product [Symbiodinium sp. CCMP2592]